MNAIVAPKSRGLNWLEGFALTFLMLGFPTFASAALLLKLVRHDIAGGVVLFVVGQRVGNVEAVRQLLAGDEVSLDDRAADAIRSGYGWAHAVGAALAVAALVPAWYLRRVSAKRNIFAGDTGPSDA